MQILIATSNGKTINLEVDGEESVHQIKQKIHLMEGIPSDKQNLICDGKQLEDLQTIAEYSLEKDLINFTLKVNEIKLQIKSIGEENLIVEVEMTDTIQTLKEKIQNAKGYNPEDFTLSFKGKKLENSKATINESYLKDKSVLMLVKRTSKPNLSSASVSAVAPKNCRNNCGFYGSPAFQDYCSKCFKDLGLDTPKMIHNNNNNNAHIVSENKKNDNNILLQDDAVEDVIKQVDTSKCWKCSKRIGIYGFQCRCKYFFCEKHRFNDQHHCSFDYTAHQKANLVVRLEKVVERKVQEI